MMNIKMLTAASLASHELCIEIAGIAHTLKITSTTQLAMLDLPKLTLVKPVNPALPYLWHGQVDDDVTLILIGQPSHMTLLAVHADSVEQAMLLLASELLMPTSKQDLFMIMVTEYGLDIDNSIKATQRHVNPVTKVTSSYVNVSTWDVEQMDMELERLDQVNQSESYVLHWNAASAKYEAELTNLNDINAFRPETLVLRILD